MTPGGHWIVCDFFKTKKTYKQQHLWDDFIKRIDGKKWDILSQQEITRNTLPFLAFGHMLLNRFIPPLVDFYSDELQRKKPGAYYLVDDSVKGIKKEIQNKLRYIDPQVFLKERKYMLLVIEKIGS